MSENQTIRRSQPPAHKAARARLTKAERHRQLVGIGLKYLTERPIQDVSLDEVARAAGISRSLLFHYFPTKTAYYEEVVAAAGRRVARTVRADEGVTGEQAVGQILERYIAQIGRRRNLYLSLVHGSLAELGGSEVMGTLREVLTSRVVAALAVTGAATDEVVVHAWMAYVEDLTVRWTNPDKKNDCSVSADSLRDHCLHALMALRQLPRLERLPLRTATESSRS